MCLIFSFYYKEECAEALSWKKPLPIKEDLQLPPFTSPKSCRECLWDSCCTMEYLLYHRLIGVSPANVDAIVKATVALHNFQRWNSTAEGPFPQEEQRIPAFTRARRVGTNNSTQEAIAVRESFNRYFSSASGEVPWQHNIA